MSAATSPAMSDATSMFMSLMDDAMSSAYVDDAMSFASVDDATWLPRHRLPCHMPAWTTARGRLVS